MSQTHQLAGYAMLTPDRRQLKTLLTINECGSKIVRNSDFDCHLLPVGRQMAIKISVSNNFLSMLVDSINVFDCRLSGVILLCPNLFFFSKE